MASLVGGIIGIMIAAIVLFAAALPNVLQGYSDISANLSTGEQNVAKLVTLFLILGVVVATGRAFGMI